MTGLVLDKMPIDHPYQKNIALAFINYGKKGEARDHKNNVIGTFYQEPFDFKAYLEENILPKLKPHFKKVGYELTEIDVIQGWPPGFCIKRKDNKPIVLEQLAFDVEHILEVYNSHQNTKGHLVSHSVFKVEKGTAEKKSQPEYISVPKI